MDQSQRRAPGTAPRKSGGRLELLVALVLAFVAGSYFALAPAGLWREAAITTDTAADCDQPIETAAGATTCDSRPTVRPSDQPAGVAPAGGTPVAAAGRARRGTSNPAQRAAASESRLRPVDFSSAEGPRPGYTVAEFCLPGLPDEGPRCRTGSYRESFVTPAATTAPGAAAGHTIAGQVLTNRGDGLPEVAIVATPERLRAGQGPAAGTLRFWTVTNSRGAYTLDGLPEGEYTIRARVQAPYRAARISARTGVDYADLVVAEDSEMIVEGQVFSADGWPLEGVTVLPLVLGQASVLTGDDGRFRLPVTVKPTVRSVGLRFQRPGYHEHTGKVAFAHRVAATTTADDVVMQPVDSWTAVNGTVYGDSGEPLAGLAVELRPQSARQSYRTTTDRWGQFAFPAVECPADYRLIVFGGSHHKDYHEPVRITADTGELNVVTESYEFGEVTGQLVNANGEPVPEFDLVLRNTGSRRPNSLVSTDEYGNFEIPAAPAGELVVASQSTPSILVQGLHLPPGERLHVPLVLDWGEHEIRGVVVDARGNPVPASRIVLQWSHSADGITTKATRRTAADTQGQFAFSNLGPGPHSLQVEAPGFPPVDIQHDLSRQGYDLMVRLN